MADLKISEMPDGGLVQVTDEIPVNRSNANFKVKVGSGATANIGNDVGDVIVWADDGGGNSLYPFGNGQNIINISASNVEYDNSVTNLPASNVQDAIDFLYYNTDPLSRIDVPPSYRLRAKPEQDDPLLDFERSTVANRINARGLIQQVGINEIRHQYNPSLGSYLGWLIERGVSNLVPYSYDFTDGSWFKTNSTTTLSSDLAPDGETYWTRLEKSANTSASVRYQPTAVVGTAYSYGVYAKSGTLNTVTIGVTSSLNTIVVLAYLDLDTGAITYIAGSSGVRAVDMGGGVWRIVVDNRVASATNPRLFIYPGQSNQGIAGDIFIWQADIQNTTRLSSPIKTNGTAVTRANDQASLTLPEAVTEGTIYFEGRSLEPIPSSQNNGYFINISDNSDSEMVSIRKNTSGLTLLSVRVGNTDYNSSTVNIPTNTPFRAALSFKDGQLFGSINGVPVTFASVPPTINSMSVLRIGSYGDGSNVNNGMISKDNAYYYRALNQDQINRITAI